MNKQKSLIAIIIIALISISTYFICSKFDNKNTTEDVIKIAFVVPTLENPFFVDMVEAAKAKAKELGNVEIIVKATTKVEDALGQNQIVEDLVIQKVDGICIVPINSKSILPAILKANKANIPVINIDNKIDMLDADLAGAKIVSYIGSDNFDGGKLAGQFMIEKLAGKGKVAILEGVSGNDAAIKRKSGFLDELKSSPDIHVVSSQVANWNREQAFNIFQNILKANPDLNGIFAANDEMALGAFSALNQSKIPKSKIIIVGFDAVKEAVDAINKGDIDATIAQQPALMGRQGVQLILDAINKKPLEKSYSTELKLIKK